MAGTLLNSLRSSPSSMASLSHETKLGMIVISILFFAFCFLVYHKMDLHERRLQQASISPTAGEQETGTTTPAVAESLPDSDPLFRRSQQTENPVQTESEFPVAQRKPVALPQWGDFTEELTQPVSAEAYAEPDISIDRNPPKTSIAASVAVSAVEPDMGVPDINFTASSADTVPFDSFTLEEPTTQPAAERPESVVASRGSQTGSIPELNFEFDEPGGAEADSSVAADGTSTATAPTAFPPLFPSSDEINTIGERREPETTPEQSPVDSPLISFDAPDDGDTVAFPVEQSETRPDTFDDRNQRTSPRLLAMADPPSSGGFSDGFFPAESNTRSAFPAFDSPPSSSSTGSAPRSSSRAFDAVTQPGSRGSRNAVRTAGGSGSDGRFSLAAFNYANSDADPAPDDGTLFETTVVQEGDNYTKISRRVYGTTRYFSALAVFNQHRIPEPKNMRPGMIVLTPRKEVLEDRYPQLFADMKPREVIRAEFLILDDGSPAYRVGENETLSEIAQRFLGRSSRWVEIHRLNRTVVRDPNTLRPGLILALPDDAAEVHVVP